MILHSVPPPRRMPLRAQLRNLPGVEIPRLGFSSLEMTVGTLRWKSENAECKFGPPKPGIQATEVEARFQLMEDYVRQPQVRLAVLVSQSLYRMAFLWDSLYLAQMLSMPSFSRAAAILPVAVCE